MDSKTNNKDRARLEETFSTLADSFARADREVKGYQSDLEKEIAKFAAQAEAPVYASLKDELPLAKVFSSIKDGFRNDCDKWAGEIRQTAKSMSFREKLNDSMLVYVYGKVKSGKSSLGNFVAYGSHEPSAELISRSAPVVFDVEALSDRASPEECERIRRQQESTRREHRFLVDFLEATACIQYFRMPGLTWIDSPGIHSTTKENGRLASQYLESADLVVYTTTGRSALQAGDRKELADIAGHRGKPFILVATRCDEDDEDVDENGNIVGTTVMMSDKDRQDIKRWCARSMEEKLRDGGFADAPAARQAITLSCKYASEHADDEGWSRSGMPEFYARLEEIARADGVRLKRNAPLRLILSHIASIRRDMASLGGRLDETQNRLNAQKKAVDRKCAQLAARCAGEVRMRVGELARQDRGDDARFKADVERTVQTIAQQAMAELAEAVAKDAVATAIASPVRCTEDLKSFEDIVQTVSYKTTGGRRKGSLFGAVFGAVGGFLLGGPAGAAIGASLGAAGGNLAGRPFDGTSSSTVKVGDNTLEVVQDAAGKWQQSVEKALRDFADGLNGKALRPLEEWLAAMHKVMDAFSTYLVSAEEKINKEIEE